MNDRSKGAVNPAFIVGLVAIVAGGTLLLDNTGVVHAGNIFRLWPVALIVLGLNGVAQRPQAGQHGGRLSSGLLVVFGVMLLAANYGYLHWNQIWPMALIAFGVALLFGTIRKRGASAYVSEGTDCSSIFSGVEKDVIDRAFQRGSAKAVFGNVVYDFTQADIAGDTAYLDIEATFGSVEVRVPLGWRVDIQAEVVFGAAENKTRGQLQNVPAKTLIIRGKVVFGSVEVKN